MRRPGMPRATVAAILSAIMLVSVTGLFGAGGTTVKITLPRPGARLHGEVEVRASVSGSARVSYVILVVDNERPCVTNSHPYRFRLDTRGLPDGAHRLAVEAYDGFGLIGASRPITVYVKNGSAAPSAGGKREAGRRGAGSPPATAIARPAVGPQVVSQPAAAAQAPLAAGALTARGPLPEPTSVAVSGQESAAIASAPALSGHGTRAGTVVSDLPPAAGETRLATPASGHTIMLDGKVVVFDVAPRVVGGRLQAGFRALFTARGGRVTWCPATRTARSESPDLIVEVPVGSTTARVNGTAVAMGGPATIVEGRTQVPVRFFAEATGATLNWDARTRVAALMSRSAQTARAE